ncbi:MAG: sigma-70 family RNA polymerase sigma factor [bacterium]
MTDLSDAELIARLRRSDGIAIGILYARFATPLLGLAHRLLGSRDEAEDVVQDVFVGLPLALRRYNEQGAFAAWLKLVTVRTALMHRRSSARRRQTPLDAPDARGRATAPEPLIDRMVLEAAIAALPEALRDVFVLYHIERFSHAEIAQMLGIRRGTAEVRLHRAVRRLRAHLENDR